MVIMISKINIIKERIEFLKKGIDSLNHELAITESAIDRLECYPARGSKLDELYEECEKIEKAKIEYRDEIVELNKTLESITRYENLKGQVDKLEEKIAKDPTSPAIFELSANKQEMNFIEGQIAQVANKITKK